VSWETFKKET